MSDEIDLELWAADGRDQTVFLRLAVIECVCGMGMGLTKNAH